jgi:hypothetical protein
MDLKHLARLMLNDAEQNCEDLAWANELSRVGAAPRSGAAFRSSQVP